MILSPDIKKYIDQSVLCWLATVSEDGIPNVSPKEIFTYFENVILIANIASPNTVKNIESNERICISFIDILVQKGYQLKGTARIIDKSNIEFESLKKILNEMTEGQFPFATITIISVDKSKPIISPRYMLFPDTKEEDQIKSAINTYKLNQTIT